MHLILAKTYVSWIYHEHSIYYMAYAYHMLKKKKKKKNLEKSDMYPYNSRSSKT